jgi:hypothetical protein
MPRGQEFATIGHLYRGISDGLHMLAARLGEPAVFVGSPRAQATPELFHWPELIAVTDLASASAAITEIIEQGEGARGDWREAHYGRFLGIWEEYHALRARDPAFEPTRPVVAAYTRQPFDNLAQVPIVTEPRTRHIAELAALAYELVLQTLNRFFTHTDETDEQLGVLIRAAVGLTSGVLAPLATEMTRLPVGAAPRAHGAARATLRRHRRPRGSAGRSSASPEASRRPSRPPGHRSARRYASPLTANSVSRSRRAAEPELVAVGVAVRYFAHAVGIGFPVRWAESALRQLGDEAVEVVDEDEVPRVPGVLGAVLDKDEQVLGKLPHGFSVVGKERRG